MLVRSSQKCLGIYMPKQLAQLLLTDNLRKQRIALNRLIVISAFNMLTFASSLFSMIFYRWAFIAIDTRISLWVNLLYVTLDTSYEMYKDASVMLCVKDDSNCLAAFIELQFVGGLCFAILSLAYLLQGYDLFVLVKYLCQKNRLSNWFENDANHANLGDKQMGVGSQQETKSAASHLLQAVDNLRTLVTIGSYCVSLTLYSFALYVMDVSWHAFGEGFWVLVGTLGLYVIVIINERCSMRNMEKHQRILRIIKKQQEIRAEHHEPSLRDSFSSSFEV